MGSLGWPEIMIILVIALIIFGPRKLPELGKSLGNSLAHFRRASEDFKRTWEDEVEAEKRKLDLPTWNEIESSTEPASTNQSDSSPPEIAAADTTDSSQESDAAKTEETTVTVPRTDTQPEEKQGWM